MKISAIGLIASVVIAALLAWWLWIMGEDTLQKWLLAAVGGVFMCIGFIGSMGINYENERSGVQTRIVFSILALVNFGAACIYSFFSFSPEGYCIPMGVFSLLWILLGVKVYQSKE